MIADKFNTDHHKIKRILEKYNIEITNKGKKRKSSKGYKRKPFTEEHKRNISLAQKGRIPWSKGKTMPKETLYKNMAAHLHRNVSIEWLKSFEDIEKLKCINSLMFKDRVRDNFTDEEYVKFVEYFYYEDGFNITYNNWLNENKVSFAKPSLDHKVPLSKGGTWELSNLQIIPWCVNRAKFNYMPDEWEYIRKKYLSKEGGFNY